VRLDAIAARLAALPRRITDPDELEADFLERNGGPPETPEQVGRYVDLFVRPADKDWAEEVLTEWCLQAAP
jgi:hypothetical protein